MASGALGGKLLGAGGGGFLLFYCPPENQERLRVALRLRRFPFSFEKEERRWPILGTNIGINGGEKR